VCVVRPGAPDQKDRAREKKQRLTGGGGVHIISAACRGAGAGREQKKIK